MEYEGVICRPPMELGAFLLPVAVGCTHNQCTFCSFYKEMDFRVIPLEEVEAELTRASKAGRPPRRIMLGDGNPFVLKTDRLLTILDMIRRHFPDMPPVHMDATIGNIAAKNDEELRALRQAGVRELYVGIECGVDETLVKLKKGHTVQQAKEQLARLREAGLDHGAHLMLGSGGVGMGEETALKTAEFLNETRPKDAINVEMFVHRRTELYRQIKAGEFLRASALESLEEERLLIQQIQVPVNYDGFHCWKEFHVWGPLPEKREAMLAKLDQAITRCREEQEAPRPAGGKNFGLQRVRITPVDSAAV